MPRGAQRAHLLGLALAALLMLTTTGAVAEKRLALVVGNDLYTNLSADQQLRKAVNDARGVGEALGKLGFEVIRGENLGRQALVDKFDELTQKISPGDVVLFFFAGHGVSIGGGNYILPSDVPNVEPGQDTRLARASLSENDIVSDLQARSVRVAVIVLDACRNNPFKRPGTRSVGAERGLARIDPVRGVFSLYSAGIGQSALDRLGDSDPDPNSIFSRVLIPSLGKTGLDLGALAIEVREQVARLASSVGHDQRPAYYDETIGGRVYLAGLPAAGGSAAAPVHAADPCEHAAMHWRGVESIGTAAALQDHINRFPLCAFAVLARARLDQLGTKTAALRPPSGPPTKRGRRSIGNLQPFGGHSYMNTWAITQDRSWIASGHADGSIRIWDVAGKRPIRILHRHTDRVVGLFFYPDGRMLLSVGSDDRIVQWDLNSWSVSAEIERPYDGRKLDGEKVKLSADGNTLVVATATKNVMVFDGRTLRRRSSYDLGSYIDSIAVTSDGSRIGLVNDYDSGNNINSFVIADSRTGSVLARMSRPKDPDYYWMEFADSGDRLVARADSRLKLIDVRGNRTVWDVEAFYTLSLRPDEGAIWSTSGDDFAVFDLTSGKELQRGKLNRDKEAGQGLSRTQVVTDGNSPLLIDPDSGEVVSRFMPALSYTMKPAFARSSSAIVLPIYKSQPLVFDLASGKVEKDWVKVPASLARSSADGQRILLAQDARGVIVDAATARTISDITLPTKLPKDFYIAATTDDLNWIQLREGKTNRWEVWDIQSLRLVESGSFGSDRPSQLAMSSTLKLLAMRPKWDTVDIRDTASKRSLAQIKSTERYKSIYDVVISPDGQTLAYDFNDTVVIYDLTSRRRVAQSPKLDQRDPFFLPKGNRIHGGDSLLDASSGRVLKRLPSPLHGAPYNITVSPDERWIVTGKDFGLVLWNLDQEKRLATIFTFGGGEWAVITDAGYTASPGSLRYLVVEQDGELLPIDDDFRRAFARDASPIASAR